MIQEPPELMAMRLALGQQLAALREAAGIVQQQIARRTGYSRSSVAKAEAGRQLLQTLGHVPVLFYLRPPVGCLLEAGLTVVP